MFACKVRCRTTVFLKVEEDELTLEEAKARFNKLKKQSRVISIKKIYDYKHWKNDHGEIAATMEVDVLVRNDPYVDYMADYELRACRVIREEFFTAGTAIQALDSQRFQPLRKRPFR
ncbi:hypothetical protein MKX54_18775 [Alkalihalobacillus sp. FSL R5-0424]